MSEAVDEAEPPLPPEDRRSFDRLINFTDAVVAIALTLQLLPLTDIPGPQEGQTVWQVLADNWGQIFAFLLSFIIVIVMWTVHNRLFNVMRTYDSTILWLNIAWMLSIAFLPWPTAMYGNAASSDVLGRGGVGLFYWANLALISGLGGLIAHHARTHPELLEPGAVSRGWLARSARARWRGAAFAGYLLLIGVASEIWGSHAGWLALGLMPLGRIFNDRGRSAPAESDEPGTDAISTTNDRQPSATPPTAAPPSS